MKFYKKVWIFTGFMGFVFLWMLIGFGFAGCFTTGIMARNFWDASSFSGLCTLLTWFFMYTAENLVTESDKPQKASHE